MNQAKKLLRISLRAKRLAMTEEEVLKKSVVISEKLLAEVSWENVRSLHIYSSVPAWKEVSTEPIIKGLKENWPSIEITVAGLSKAQPLSKKQYDLIIVPILGFDAQNHRLGLGGGFYDRFLATQKKALKIGIGFSMGFREDGLPREKHDIALDKIITEV